MSEKLQKHLAHLGFASRRAIEEWIKDGRITINGRTAKLGDRVTEKDVITVDNKPVNPPEGQQDTRVILLHKPVGVICTRNDPEGRPTVFDGLPKIRNARWVSIGRLDINTSGLLLFTNNGELANKLMHPSQQVEREYAVRVLGDVTQSMLKKLTQGVMLDDGKARFEHLVDSGGKGANHWYHVVVVEGRNRVVRRLWESQDLTVSRLQRVRYGPIVLPKSVPRGRWVELDAKQVESLLAV